MIQGYHLLADGSGVLSHPGDILRWLNRAVEVTGLTVIAGPVVDEAHGIGFVVIAESHISAHIQGARAFVDCFSCQPFPWARVVAAAQDIFGGDWTARYFVRSRPAMAPRSGRSSVPAGRGVV